MKKVFPSHPLFLRVIDDEPDVDERALQYLKFTLKPKLYCYAVVLATRYGYEYQTYQSSTITKVYSTNQSRLVISTALGSAGAAVVMQQPAHVCFDTYDRQNI